MINDSDKIFLVPFALKLTKYTDISQLCLAARHELLVGIWEIDYLSV